MDTATAICDVAASRYSLPSLPEAAAGTGGDAEQDKYPHTSVAQITARIGA